MAVDVKVEKYLADLKNNSAAGTETVFALRETILSVDKSLTESIMYGGLLYKRDKFLLFGIFLRKDHVTLEIGGGASLEDEYGVLEGIGGKEGRRHIKLKNLGDIKDKHVEHYLKLAFDAA